MAFQIVTDTITLGTSEDPQDFKWQIPQGWFVLGATYEIVSGPPDGLVTVSAEPETVILWADITVYEMHLQYSGDDSPQLFVQITITDEPVPVIAYTGNPADGSSPP